MSRADHRSSEALRPVEITRNYTRYCAGSVLVSFGQTRVLCTVSNQPGVPKFLRGKHQGWITAEYGMLPGATHSRNAREAVRGKQTGRSLEIQRLIGRALRRAVHLDKLSEYSLHVDCDVLQADGGTRTAAITGAAVALYDAVNVLIKAGKAEPDAWHQLVAAVSVGVVGGKVLLDLDYEEDSTAETDCNVVMTETGGFVEIQSTAERTSFTNDELAAMLGFAENGIAQLVAAQQRALEQAV